MTRIFLSIALVLGTIFIVPFLVYSVFTFTGRLTAPEGLPAQFLLGVLVSKMGTAAAFVLLFFLARGAWQGRWLSYALAWWLLFAFGEVGQALGPDYTWAEALAGLLSETVYVPLSAWTTSRLLPVS